MIRLLTFAIAFLILALYFYRILRSQRPKKEPFDLPSAPAPKVKRPPKKSAQKTELWVQVYDTESNSDVRKIQKKFQDMGIQCLVYEQGKKDVYGEVLKHYGISVPRASVGESQSILAKIAL